MLVNIATQVFPDAAAGRQYSTCIILPKTVILPYRLRNATTTKAILLRDFDFTSPPSLTLHPSCLSLSSNLLTRPSPSEVTRRSRLTHINNIIPLSLHQLKLQRLSHSSDTSVPLFTLYLRTAEDHDAIRCKELKGDIDQILVFCGLFSATVAALIVPTVIHSSSSYSDLVPSLLQQNLSVLEMNSRDPSAYSDVDDSDGMTPTIIL
ncbi:hypothetical protein DFH94DRAFT_110073 [Russula ochroleuca]|uniref:DUF6535 domain-containing protein n=1 Tax=Russula ochroleuca TaxID=152965 RepID=A0A9P5MRX0_9AGAM|nr:hypothetical protein DFH94DRAFT_110073 [Russula ochroleuca]